MFFWLSLNLNSSPLLSLVPFPLLDPESPYTILFFSVCHCELGLAGLFEYIGWIWLTQEDIVVECGMWSTHTLMHTHTYTERSLWGTSGWFPKHVQYEETHSSWVGSERETHCIFGRVKRGLRNNQPTVGLIKEKWSDVSSIKREREIASFMCWQPEPLQV